MTKHLTDPEQDVLISELQRRATDPTNPLRAGYAKWLDNIGAGNDCLDSAAVAWIQYGKYYDAFTNIWHAIQRQVEKVIN